MVTVGATQLCWAILGFLLLQGHNCQPTTTQTSSSQGAFSNLSLTIEPTSPNTDTFQNITPESTTMSLRTGEYLTILPSPTSESVLTVAAFGVISFIVILVVVVIILVSVVSLRFKCRKNKESEDPQKPGSSGISESCSTANGEKDSITLISMKNINMNNSKECSSAEKVRFSCFLLPFPKFTPHPRHHPASYLQVLVPEPERRYFQRPSFSFHLPYPATSKKFILPHYVFILQVL
ncbi:endothelial cell-specific chemotaxis regulator isoform 2-T2 [Trichechus inunguis]